MVVQPNYPQDNSGAKGASWAEILAFHAKATRDNYKPADLVIWSETMMPELNGVYREYMHEFVTKEDRTNVGAFLDSVHNQLGDLASSLKTNLLVGGHTMLPDRPVAGKPTWNRRNSAYLFDREGRESTVRYDKIHLVPFGEYMPFRESFPPLYKFFDLFNPYKGSDYTVQAGSELTLFPLETTSPTAATYHFVPAICFEDVDAPLMARAIAGPDGGKRADFIVNLTNDGWFATPQMQQHLQLSVFRCIENRVPTARSVNTGISGYIDPLGRVYDTIPVHTTGARVARLTLDHRVGPYTHIGDVFGWTCFAAAVGAALAGMVNGVKARRAARR
jgi:apolipoprotein N-acyltransferase